MYQTIGRAAGTPLQEQACSNRLARQAAPAGYEWVADARNLCQSFGFVSGC
jgi:hypothetical protein